MISRTEERLEALEWLLGEWQAMRLLVGIPLVPPEMRLAPTLLARKSGKDEPMISQSSLTYGQAAVELVKRLK